MGDLIKDEMRMLSQVVLLATLTVFSIVLIALNISSGWEKWTIPVFAVSVFACFVMHISGRPTEKVRIHFYSIFICIQLFYYILNTNAVFNCTPLSILAVVLLSMTKERRIIWICAATSTLALIIRAFDSGSVGRVIWHVFIIWTASFVAIRFIGETRRTEDAYKRYISILKQQNKSADDFLANVSHEIRTPVNAVIGLTGVCLENEANDENRKNLELISEAGRRISEQISDILDYSEIEGENLAVNYEDYRISVLVQDLCNTFKPLMKSGVEIIFDTDPQIPSVMKTDTGKLKRILWHIITNGIKYTQSGGVYVHFSTTPQEYGANLCIDVTDTGVGMTEDEKERIYEHFYQSDSGRNRTSGGLGLGMSIARGFVDAMEGFISVESVPNSGTTVHICLPQKVIQDTPCMVMENSEDKVIGAFLDFDKYNDPFIREYFNRMVLNVVNGLKITMHRVDNIENLKKLKGSIKLTHLIVGEEEYLTDVAYMDALSHEMILMVVCDEDFVLPENSEAKILRRPFSSFRALRIINMDKRGSAQEEGHIYCKGIRALIVDDESMNITVAESILKRYGIETKAASSGEESVEICRNRDFDLIFMDYMMPRMDGIEAARLIRSIKANGDGRIPLMIAFTADAVSTAREKFMNEGFDAFLSKPVDITELERILKALLPETAFVSEGLQEDRIYGMENNNMENQNKDIAGNNTPGPEAGSSDPGFEMLSHFGIDPVKGMSYCMNDVEMYTEVLKEYARDAESKLLEMDEYFESGEWPEFTVRIHSVKSSSLMIGAEELSNRAKELEKAAKSGDVDYVKENYPPFIPDYLKTVQAITEAYGTEDDQEV